MKYRIFNCLICDWDAPGSLSQLPGRLADRRCVQVGRHYAPCASGKNAMAFLKPSESPWHNGVYAIMPRGLYTAKTIVKERMR